MRPRESRKYQYGKDVPIYAEVVFWGKNGRIGECGIYGKVFAFVEIDQTLRKEIKIFQTCFPSRCSRFSYGVSYFRASYQRSSIQMVISLLFMRYLLLVGLMG